MEQQNSQTNTEKFYSPKKISIILFFTILAALLSGGSIYSWQSKKINNLENRIISTKEKATDQNKKNEFLSQEIIRLEDQLKQSQKEKDDLIANTSKTSFYSFTLLKDIQKKIEPSFSEPTKTSFEWRKADSDLSSSIPEIKNIKGWEIKVATTNKESEINEYFLKNIFFNEDLHNAAGGPTGNLQGFKKRIESEEFGILITVCLIETSLADNFLSVKCGSLE